MSPKATKRKKKETDLDQVICGDALHVCQGLESNCVDVVVTSPPYYRQRDYGSDRQIGQEASPETYVQRIAETVCGTQKSCEVAGIRVDGDWRQIRWRRIAGNAVARLPGYQGNRVEIEKRLYLA